MHEVDLCVERAKNLPEEAYSQMVEASIKLTTLEATAAMEHSYGAQQLKEEYSAQLASLLGPERLAKYLTFRKEQAEQLRAARRNAAPTRQGHEGLEAIRLQVLERSRAFLTQLDVNPDKLKQLTGDLHGRAAALLRRTSGADEHGAASAQGNGGNGAQKEQQSRLPLFCQPPFYGTSTFVNRFRYASESSEELVVPSFKLYLSRFTGEVGSSTYTHPSDASDYDTAWVLCRTAVLSWFQMPRTGQVRVIVTVQTVSDEYSGSVVNEWAGSQIDLRQSRLVYGQVTSPVVSGRAYSPFWSTSQYHDTNEDMHDWLYHRSTTGQKHWSQDMVIPGIFAAGTWVLVNVGIEHFNFFSANDCSATCGQVSRFRIKDIVIDATGS